MYDPVTLHEQPNLNDIDQSAANLILPGSAFQQLFSTAVIQFLQQVGFAKYVPESELEQLAKTSAIVTLSPGYIFLSEGDKSEEKEDDEFYLLWRGKLQVYTEVDPGKKLAIAELDVGQWVGKLQALLGGEQLTSVQAIEKSQLICFPKSEMIRLSTKYPEIHGYFVSIAQKNLKQMKFASLLYELFGEIDFSCMIELQKSAEWLQIQKRDCLFAQGESAEGLYFVLNGRLNAVIEDSPGKIRSVASIASGEILGELSILTNAPRSVSVYALRDSVLIRYRCQQFQQIVERYPSLLLKITKHSIDRFKRGIAGPQNGNPPERRIAILAHDRETPLNEFSGQLDCALSSYGTVLHLNRQFLVEFFEFSEPIQFCVKPVASQKGMGAACPKDLASFLSNRTPQKLRFQLWLEEQEENYDFILFEADSENSAWTQFCLGQADRIVWLAKGETDPSLSPIERQVQAKQHPAIPLKQTLVLIHPSSLKLPSQTCNWLAPRTLDLHHHIRWQHQSDVERVSRFLAHRAVGVALGGGGGRGAAHLGVLQALEEANVPVDFIGGTSIGGLIAAQYAMGWEIPEMVQRNQEMLAKKNPFKAYTIPILSLVNQKKLDGMLQSLYGDVQLEDLWLNCFCVSTNISIGEKAIHRTGSLWKALRASVAVPGVFTPLIEAGELFVDGSAVDNDPSLTMRELNPGPVVLSSVAPGFVPKVPFTYEELPSPLEVLWHWLNPWSKPIECPNLPDILALSMGINSIKNHKQSFAVADLALAPPLEQYGIFEFKAIDEIINVSYQYALDRIANWPACGAFS